MPAHMQLEALDPQASRRDELASQGRRSHQPHHDALGAHLDVRDFALFFGVSFGMKADPCFLGLLGRLE